jgi:hypothetical protein
MGLTEEMTGPEPDGCELGFATVEAAKLTGKRTAAIADEINKNAKNVAACFSIIHFSHNTDRSRLIGVFDKKNFDKKN